MPYCTPKITTSLEYSGPVGQIFDSIPSRISFGGFTPDSSRSAADGARFTRCDGVVTQLAGVAPGPETEPCGLLGRPQVFISAVSVV